MSRKWIAVLLAVVMVAGTAGAFAATEVDVTLTVTIRSLGVSVTPSSYGFGIMNLGETKVSTSALVVKNEGNAAEDIGIRIKTEDSKGQWSAGSTAGTDTYVLSTRLAENAGTFGSADILTTAVQWCDGTKFGGGGDDMAAAAEVNQWFQLATPTAAPADDGTEHTITVEVSCRAAE